MKEFAPFRLDAADQTLWRENQRVSLTPKAFAVLQFLVERAGRLVTQNELLEALWPNTFVQPEVLKSQILDIRTALGDRPKEPLFIETVPRRGYRFIAAVSDASERKTAGSANGAGRIVGRDRPLDELRACLLRASRGERQVVFVTGEQGMGKTALVETFLAELSASGVDIARGQCLEGFGGANEPYYPVLEALGQLAHGPARDSLAQVLETYAPTWLIQFPAFLKREHRDVLQRELIGATRERMIREICEALERLTEQSTLVILFEDLHWTDPSTVDLLVALARRRAPAKLLVLGTYRPVDVVLARHPLKDASHSLKTHRVSHEIALAPLAVPEVAEYLVQQEITGAPAQRLAQWIEKQTEGNPLFMVTVIDHLLELGHIKRGDDVLTIATPLDQIENSVPDTLRQLIELQIERLSPSQQVVLDAASVHGMTFSAAITAAALDMDSEEVEDACHKLARQNHIIRAAELENLPDGSISQKFEFAHAAFRSVFYSRLSHTHRLKLHRRFGEKIESLYAQERINRAAELAGHFEQCREWQRAAEYLTLAAQKAWQRLNYREALAILEQALSVASRLPDSTRAAAEIKVLLPLSVLLQVLHETPRVLPTLELIAQRANSCNMTEVEAHAILASVFFQAREDCRACTPLMERARPLLAKLSDPVAREELGASGKVAEITLFGWDDKLADEHRAHIEAVRKSDDRVALATSLGGYSLLQWLSGDYSASLQTVHESLGTLLEAGRLVLYLQGREVMATTLRFIGRWGESLDILDETIEAARKNESQVRLAMSLLMKAALHLEATDYNGVLEMCERVRPWVEGLYMRDRKYRLMAFVGSAKLGLGLHDDGLRLLQELYDAMVECPVTISWYWRPSVLILLSEGWLRKGNIERARIEADRALALAWPSVERHWKARMWDLSARVALAEGDTKRAERDLQKALALIDGVDVPLAAWRVHATAAKVRSDVESVERHLAHSRYVISALAKSLDSRPALRDIFLASPAVAQIGVET